MIFQKVAFMLTAALAIAGFSSAWAKQSYRSSDHRPALDVVEVLFLAIVSWGILVGWLGVILASLGIFSLLWLALLQIFVAVALLIICRHVPKGTVVPPTVSTWSLILVLLVAAILYFRPHEYVLGGSDAGTYMNVGATIAQTGTFVVHDAWVKELGAYPDIAFREQPPGIKTRYLQFVGWYIDDHDSARVIPQFFPFHPTWIAVGIGLGGLRGGALVTPLWGCLSVAAVYFMARRLFNPRIGLLAAALLAVTPTQIYFSRYPTTEPLTLLLVFSGLLAFQVLWDEQGDTALWGWLGGTALGVALLTRIDLLVVWLLCWGALAVRRWWLNRWSMAWTVFAGTLGVMSLHAMASALWLNWPYVWNTYRSVLLSFYRSLPGPEVMLASGLLLVAMGAIGFWVWHYRAVTWSTFAFYVRWALVISVVMLSGYAYFVRPAIEPLRYMTSWPAGLRVPILNRENWVRIGWYLTPLSILLATLGLAKILRNEPLRRLALFLAIGIFTTVQYVYNIFNMPYHIYTMRRYVPIVIPFLIICAAFAIYKLAHLCRERQTLFCMVGLGVVLGGGLIYQSRFVIPQQDFKGAIDQLEALDDRLQSDAILILATPPEDAFSDNFGIPLRWLFGHDIATIRQDNASVIPFLEWVLDYAQRQERPVQLLAIRGIPTVVQKNLQLEPQEMFPIHLNVLMSTYFDYPSIIQPVYYGVDVYNVLGMRQASIRSSPVHIDVGGIDTYYVVNGFYDKEQFPDGSLVRWTSGEAVLQFPSSGEEVCVNLRAKIFRPEENVEESVEVYLDGQKIGDFVPTETWQTFTFEGHAQPAGNFSLLKFESPTFNPAVLGISGDDRSLGFVLDEVWILPRQQEESIP